MVQKYEPESLLETEFTIAYSATTYMGTFLCRCRIWIEDSNGLRIAGDDGYRDCGEGNYLTIDFQDQTYTVHAKVDGSFEQQKVRGPFNENTCYSIHGSVDKWKFDQKSC
ncbi:hypothetical protein RhiirC2_715390 [Rhizophagus irregularis]|uniref:Uncharacterized protein n=1 Tax=Rhizophagus irregularis TaxID=588596 RepID=A0A2N1MVL1_9GLOM|nr:hypothetical protein RhiirC2_715390 [Rhizophagus irregularis]